MVYLIRNWVDGLPAQDPEEGFSMFCMAIFISDVGGYTVITSNYFDLIFTCLSISMS